jgi:hypothetical protein
MKSHEFSWRKELKIKVYKNVKTSGDELISSFMMVKLKEELSAASMPNA